MIPICNECHFWRDYDTQEEMQQHPDYDGHCILLGIMTLNVTECKHLNEELKFRPLKLEKPKRKLDDEDYVRNPWTKWRKTR